MALAAALETARPMAARITPTARELGCLFHVNAEPSLTVDGLGDEEIR